MRDERGFTLVELLVAIILMTIVLGAVLTVFDTFNAKQATTARRNDAQESARRSVDQLSRELRNAISAVAAGAPVGEAVERATPYDLVFVSISPAGVSGTNTAGRQRVRYCLDATDPANGRLIRQVDRTSSTLPVLPAASTGCPVGGWTQTQVLAQNVTNRRGGADRPVFSYRFGTTGSTALNDLVAISPHVFVDVTSQANTPPETDLRSAVVLRNANQPPVALFSSTQQGARLVLNASASIDPERQPLTYKWYVDGAELVGKTDARVETGNLSYANHAIRLVVEDTAGVKAEITQTIGVTP